MAEAMNDQFNSDLNFLTDCIYFVNGCCKLDDKCRFRHCCQAVEQLKTCDQWPKKCRNVRCPYRHPTFKSKLDKKKPLVVQTLENPLVQAQVSSVKQRSFISFFWDIENVPIPRGQRPFDIVQRIRQKLVTEPGLQEVSFSCYCDIKTIPQENLQSLHQATVRIVHVADRKSGAVDRQIMLDLDSFERVHRPPSTVVLISGDIDFIGKLSNLRHHAGFHVIVIHNKCAKQELKATVNEHYSWELFTEQCESTSPKNEREVRSFTSNHSRRHSTGPSTRRRDPSPCRRIPLNRLAPLPKIKHRCPICNNEFDSIPSLRQHQTAKDHLFPCPICKEKFPTNESQTTHQKDTNHYTRDYKCEQCNRSFAKIESLNQHQQATGHVRLISNEHDPMRIILQGIEAIKQVYMKS